MRKGFAFELQGEWSEVAGKSVGLEAESESSVGGGLLKTSRLIESDLRTT